MARLPDPSLVTSLTVDLTGQTANRYLQVTQGDVRDLTFGAGETVTGVTAELQVVRSRETVAGPVADGGSDGPLAVALATPTATVTVTAGALAIGEVYELLVTFAESGGEFWTRTLPVEVLG